MNSQKFVISNEIKAELELIFNGVDTNVARMLEIVKLLSNYDGEIKNQLIEELLVFAFSQGEKSGKAKLLAKINSL